MVEVKSGQRPNSAAVYVRHRPETTLLYQIVQEYWPEFQAELASHGRYLPAYVTKEFDEYLKCGSKILSSRLTAVAGAIQAENIHFVGSNFDANQ